MLSHPPFNILEHIIINILPLSFQDFIPKPFSEKQTSPDMGFFVITKVMAGMKPKSFDGR